MKRKEPVTKHLASGLVITALTSVAVACPDRPVLAQEVRAGAHPGYGRLVFDWKTPVTFKADVVSGTLVIQFDRPVTASLDALPSRLKDYIGPAKISPDRQTVTFPLKGEFRATTREIARAAVIDLSPASGSPAAADSAPAAAQTTNPRLIPVRTGAHKDFFRVVLDWPRTVPYTVETRDGALVARFESPGRVDLTQLNARLPEGLKGVSARQGDGALTLTFPLPAGNPVRHFRSGNSVALDLMAPGSAPAENTPNTENASNASEAAAGGPSGPASPATATANASGSAPATPAPQTGAPGTAPADATPAVTGPDPVTGRPPAVIPPAPAPAAAAGAKAPAATATGPANATDATAATAPATPEAIAPAPAPGATPGAPSPVGATAQPPAPRMATTGGILQAPAPGSGPDVEPPMPEAAPSTPVTEAVAAGAVPHDQFGPSTWAFHWDEPSSAAAFRRDSYVWVVFDKASSVDVEAFKGAFGDAVEFVQQVKLRSDVTALRMILEDGINPSFRRDGLTWILELTAQPLAPVSPLDVIAQEGQTPDTARLYIPVPGGGSVFEIFDPEDGTPFHVVCISPVGNGIGRTERYTDLTLDRTAQGIVVSPIREKLTVASTREGIVITADEGLVLSETTTAGAQALPGTVMGRDYRKVYDFPRWFGEKRDEPFPSRQNTFLSALVQDLLSSPAERSKANMDMAHFYLANGLGAEALGATHLLDSAVTRGFVDGAEAAALKGAALFLMGRDDEAIKSLSDPELDVDDDVRFWRSAAIARRNQDDATKEVKQFLAENSALIRDYPPGVRTPLALVAATAAIDIEDSRGASILLDLATAPKDNTTFDTAHLTYLEGRQQELLADYETARDTYRSVERMPSEKWYLQALRSRLTLEYDLGLIPVEDLIRGLEHIRYSWRGDELELGVLGQLKDLYLQNGDPGGALRVMRVATEYFPNSPKAAEYRDEMKTVFEDLYLNGGANALAPATAIALYDEFRILTPMDERGDQMISNLADMLARVDLLDQAALLLDHQLNTRLTTPGEERAKIGARLALLRLLGAQSEFEPERRARLARQALATIESSAYPAMPLALHEQRNRIAARALADLGQPDRAIALLEGDNSREAITLRTQINWKARNWKEVARNIARLVPVPARGETLSDDAALDVLDWATALYLAGDEPQLGLLRKRYRPALENTPVFEAFDLITSPGDYGRTNVVTLNQKVQQADRFGSYLSTYREKLVKEGLSSLN
ncbi:tetratricopeptide repeat protein [Phaeovibrio sulfidiphilus]|uniref:Tetratricopeptide repeat protein n=1 Tax=Phaeovibrio sulfidiphilus TaxID=1220600 RepID=A0A8J7CPK5_9PROT|nr:tetratricopeptide repeat protein [Phaeovibrio sulfidiphilus]MBE1237097.1 tetratricopeptide repeat protein [Phaeovibrio sulfidiphilus]